MSDTFILKKTPRSSGLYCSDPLYNPLSTTEMCQCPCELIGYPHVSMQAARKKRVKWLLIYSWSPIKIRKNPHRWEVKGRWRDLLPADVIKATKQTWFMETPKSWPPKSWSSGCEDISIKNLLVLWLTYYAASQLKARRKAPGFQTACFWIDIKPPSKLS